MTESTIGMSDEAEFGVGSSEEEEAGLALTAFLALGGNMGELGELEDDEDGGGSGDEDQDDAQQASTSRKKMKSTHTALYSNIALDESSAVSAKRATTAKLFSEFLKKLHDHDSDGYPYDNLHDAATNGGAAYFTDDLLGAFVTFLLEEQKRITNSKKTKQGDLKYNTVVAYTSNLYQLLRDKYKVNIDESFVKRVRAKVLRHFVKVCQETNTQLTEGSPPMTVNDMDKLCGKLFVENTASSLQTGLLIVLQWQLVGRIGEAASLKSINFTLALERDGYCIKASLLMAYYYPIIALINYIFVTCVFCY